MPTSRMRRPAPIYSASFKLLILTSTTFRRSQTSVRVTMFSETTLQASTSGHLVSRPCAINSSSLWTVNFQRMKVVI